MVNHKEMEYSIIQMPMKSIEDSGKTENDQAKEYHSMHVIRNNMMEYGKMVNIKIQKGYIK